MGSSLRQSGKTPGCETSTFGIMRLKKRFFSPPAALEAMLEQHRKSVQDARHPTRSLPKQSSGTLRRMVEGVEAEFADDEAFEASMREVADASGRLLRQRRRGSRLLRPHGEAPERLGPHLQPGTREAGDLDGGEEGFPLVRVPAPENPLAVQSDRRQAVVGACPVGERVRIRGFRSCSPC
jgi:hypothetical protein